jgi:hypothetical protein
MESNTRNISLLTSFLVCSAATLGFIFIFATPPFKAAADSLGKIRVFRNNCVASLVLKKDK